MASTLLTTEVCEAAVEIVRPSAQALVDLGYTGDRHDLYGVMHDPTITYAPGRSIDEAILWEGVIVGDPLNGKDDFRGIARGKARVSWRTGQSTRYVAEMAPHLFSSDDGDDVKHPGSHVIDGRVAATSGFQNWFDEAVSGALLGWSWALTMGLMKGGQTANPGNHFVVPTPLAVILP